VLVGEAAQIVSVRLVRDHEVEGVEQPSQTGRRLGCTETLPQEA
jgi:hypothetical protein